MASQRVTSMKALMTLRCRDKLDNESMNKRQSKSRIDLSTDDEHMPLGGTNKIDRHVLSAHAAVLMQQEAAHV